MNDAPIADRKYCMSKDNTCECGRNGWAIKFCRRPFSDARMREIMEKLRNNTPFGKDHPNEADS